MIEPQTLVSQKDRLLVSATVPQAAHDPRQRQLMVIALALLLVALGCVLYRNRDFWFPDTQEADSDQTEETAPMAEAPTSAAPVLPAPVEKASTPARKGRHYDKTPVAKAEAKPPETQTPAPPIVATNRTVLPPLEVEVVAGDSHRTVRPGTNSVHVELQPGAPTQPMTDATATTQSAANITSNAAERVHMSADTTQVVTHSVKPGYPLLARQMKVQGSVILRALISKEGTIQDLHVLSGPAILASAAQDAVRQWRFKPHFLGKEAVETQANITVNFTISTN